MREENCSNLHWGQMAGCHSTLTHSYQQQRRAAGNTVRLGITSPPLCPSPGSGHIANFFPRVPTTIAATTAASPTPCRPAAGVRRVAQEDGGREREVGVLRGLVVCGGGGKEAGVEGGGLVLRGWGVGGGGLRV